MPQHVPVARSAEQATDTLTARYGTITASMVVVDAELLLPVALCSLADEAASSLSFVDSPILIGGDVVSLPESLFPCAVSRLNTVLPVMGCATRTGIFRFSGRRRGAVFTPLPFTHSSALLPPLAFLSALLFVKQENR